MAWLVTPLCLLLGVIDLVMWGDPVSAVLHAGLAWLLSWPLALAGLWLLAPSQPFALPYARGASLGIPPLPLAGLSVALLTAAGLHFWLAASPYFWLGSLVVCGAAAHWLGRRADERMRSLARGIA
jgi:hypothetical protein